MKANSKTKYRRKFRVPGDTIKDCWDYRNKCYEEHPDRLPCEDDWGDTDESRCPYPIGKPNEYIVSETVNGEWQCSCPAWKFRRIQCRHISKAKANPEKYEISKEFTERLTKIFDKVFEG